MKIALKIIYTLPNVINMENLVDKIIKLSLDEIETYEFPLDEPFGLEINHESVRYCLIVRFSSKNKNLICCGPGAHARDERTSKGILKTPPFFHRWSWYNHFEESFIAYADPIFFYDEHIRLGWFVGDRNQWYLETLSVIIDKLSSNQKILHDNILFYGSSGGGFSSVGLGTLIKGSKVLINNAQLNVMHYRQKHVDNLFRILYKEYPDMSKSEIIDKIGYRLDSIELFKREKYVPPINYYVNALSSDDINSHCIPFIEELCNLEYFENNFEINFYKEERAKPHSSLAVSESIKIVKQTCKESLYNTKSNIHEFENNLMKLNRSLEAENRNLTTENELLNNRLYHLKEYLYFNPKLDTGSTSINKLIPNNHTIKFNLKKLDDSKCKGFVQIGKDWNNSIFIGQISDLVFGLWLRKDGETITENSRIPLDEESVIEYSHYNNVHTFKVNGELICTYESSEYNYDTLLKAFVSENTLLTNLKVYVDY